MALAYRDWGTVAFGAGSPVRQNGGTIMAAAGSYTLVQGYQRVTDPKSVYFITIPTGGGVIREGVALNAASGHSLT